MKRLLSLPMCLAVLGVQALLAAAFMVLSVSAPGEDCGSEEDSWHAKHQSGDSLGPKTQGIMTALQLSPGMTVALVPAQRGEWAVMLAERVGPEGRVLSGNVTPACDAVTAEAVGRARLQNVTQFRSGWFSFDFPEASLERILVLDSPHMRNSPLGKSRSFVRELWDALAPQGRVVVYKAGSSQGSPSAEELSRTMEEIGFEIVSEADPLSPPGSDLALPAAERCRTLLVAKRP